MIYKKFVLLMAYLAIMSPAIANTTETTVVRTTKTVSTMGKVVELPPGGTYVFMDPIAGVLKGPFEPTFLTTMPSGIVVVDKVTGKVVATVEAGKLVDVTTIPANDAVVSAIDVRRAELLQMISDGEKKGTINAIQGSNFRSELNRIANHESVNKLPDGTLSYSSALILASWLNSLTNKVVAETNSVAIAPVISERIVTVNDQLIFVDKIENDIANLRNRVDNEFAAGRLSSHQVSQLKAKLNDISALESKFKKGGNYSENRERTLSIKLDAIKTQLDKDVAYINHKRAQIGLRVN